MIRSMEEFASAFHAARCVSTPLVAVRTADPASTTHFIIETLKQGPSFHRCSGGMWSAASMRSAVTAARNWRTNSGRSEFRILEHAGKVRKVGRNYVTRCPSCAEAGHDRSGDNLAIRIDDPRFYKCWAGCTKEMIREAVGCPIRIRQEVEQS